MKDDLNNNVEVPIDEQFESEDKMFIPLTIDDMEVEDTSYYFSGTKLLLLALGILPYMAIFFTLDYFTVLTFIIVTVLYFLIFSVYARFVVFEEGKNREAMKALENNKLSDMSYFWEWDKVGTSKRDNGLIYIQSDGATLRRAYLIKVDSGSNVGVPDGHYRNFRQTQQDFFRNLYKIGMDVKVYNIRKRPELSPALKNYSSMLRGMDGDKQNALIKLSQLNIDINFLYSQTTEQRYITYYLVINKRIENLKNFHGILDDILDKTFRANIAFFEPAIQTKGQVDEFLALYYDLDAVNATGIHKMNGFRDFNEFVDLVSVVDLDGKSVPIQIFDDIMNMSRVSGINRELEDLIEREEQQEKRWDDRRKRSYETKERALMAERRADKITHDEYERRLAKLKEDHLPENFNELVEMTDEARAKHFREKEKEELKELRRKQRHGEKAEKQKRWYERQDGLSDAVINKDTEDTNNIANQYNRIEDTDGSIRWEQLAEEDEEISLEDLMND